jgi:hypothetical protein
MGKFCSECGQKQTSGLPGIKDIVNEVLGTLFAYDGKAWRTIRVLIAQPGKLTEEYVAGKRASYVGPFQLFLWLQALAFAAHRALFDNEPGYADRKSLTLLGMGIWFAVVLFALNPKRLKNFTHSLLIAAHCWSFLMFWLLLEYSLSIPVSTLLVRSHLMRPSFPVGVFVTLSTMAVLALYLLVAIKRTVNLKWGMAVLQFSVVLGAELAAMVLFQKNL